MKKYLSLLLVLIMVVCMLPLSAIPAYADEDDPGVLNGDSMNNQNDPNSQNQDNQDPEGQDPDNQNSDDQDGEDDPPETVTVVFDYNGHGGKETESVPVTPGDTVDEPDDPVDDDYDFCGWKTAEGEDFDFSTEINEDITLTAAWTPKYVSVFFDANGHGTAPDAITVRRGEKAEEPDPPVVEGLEFGGWFKEKECENAFDFETTEIEESIILYAKWTGQCHEVSFDLKLEGASGKPANQSIPHGQKASRPETDPTAEGYKFVNWYADEDCSQQFDFDTPIEEDTVIYAKWVRQYKVSFNMNNDKAVGSLDDQYVTEGGYATAPSIETIPTAVGYRFVRWMVDAVGTSAFDFATPITKDTVIYASWIKRHEISFDVNNAKSSSVVATQIVDDGDKAKKPAQDPTAEKDDTCEYRFNGWCTDKEGKQPFDFASEIHNDLTLYGSWSKIYTVTFTVRFNNAQNKPDTQKVAENDKATKPTNPTYTGYVFLGWYEDAAGKTGFNFNKPITGNITLYDKWEPQLYKVTFVANGYGTAPAIQEVAYGNKATPPTNPTAQGVTFDGWYTDKTCKTRYNFNTPVTSDITLYAKWVDSSGKVVSNSAKGIATGDTNNVVLFYGLVTVSVIGLASVCGVFFYKRKKSSERQ